MDLTDKRKIIVKEGYDVVVVGGGQNYFGGRKRRSGDYESNSGVCPNGRNRGLCRGVVRKKRVFRRKCADRKIKNRLTSFIKKLKLSLAFARESFSLAGAAGYCSA